MVVNLTLYNILAIAMIIVLANVVSMLQYSNMDLICIYLVINEVEHLAHGYWPFIGLV